MNDQLEQIRLQINETDEQLSRLLSRRMDLVAQVAKIKETAGLPIYDPQREKAGAGAGFAKRRSRKIPLLAPGLSKPDGRQQRL